MRRALPAVFFLASLLALPAGAVRADTVELRFDELIRKPVGPRGLEFSDKLLGAQGRQVRIAGYMVREETPRAGSFRLAPQPVGEDDDESSDLPASTFTVLLDPAQSQRFVLNPKGLITIEGRLEVGRQEAPDGRVSWLRLQLAPDALTLTSDNKP
ncbi:MAG: hypothetical protein JO006_19540 [Paucibacter sp.]|nr:hypothetical protein [Roseateles sp.]